MATYYYVGTEKTHHATVIRECSFCGTTFTSATGRKTCGPACAKVSRLSAQGLKPLDTKNCAKCQKEFRPQRNANTFCSYKCTWAARNEEYADSLGTRTCGFCGDSFPVLPYKTSQIFCNRTCYLSNRFLHRQPGNKRKAKADLRKRVNSSMRRVVFERDNYTCQSCKQPGGQLHIDHVLNWSEFPEGRFDLSNLQTMCLSCHFEKTFGKTMTANDKWCRNTRFYDHERVA